MLIDKNFINCVSFLFVDKKDDATQYPRRIPVATAFFVSVPVGKEIAQYYVVTARHVIDQSRKYGRLYFRIKIEPPEYQDIVVPQDKWFYHYKTDIAVIPVDIPDNVENVAVPIEMLLTEDNVKDGGIGIGDTIFFVGLFSEYSGRTNDKPIVRFGNLSLMHEEIPLKLIPGSDTTTMADAYLVEAHSWSGQSGSPVFVYYAVDRKPGIIELRGQRFALFGLAQGHFDISQNVKFIGDILGSGTVPVNSGMAAVIPSQKIIDTLMMEELVEQRKADLEEYSKTNIIPHRFIYE